MSDRIKGSALTMGGAACWGVSGCMGQYLFTREGMDSTWLVPIRLFLAGLILCGFFFIKDRKTLFDPWNVRKNPRNAIDLLVYGLAGVSCCQFTYFLTIQLSSAGMGTILQDVSPVIILLVVCIQQKRGPRVFEIFSIVLALVGVFLITTHGSLTGLAVSPAALPWVVIRKTPTSASRMEKISNTRGPRLCWMQTTSRIMTGERSCKIVPMPAPDSWIVRK